MSSRASAIVLVAGALGLVGLLGYGIWQSSAGSSTPAAADTMDKQDQANCTHSPVKASVPGVQTVPCKSANHVSEGSSVTYDSDPPLAGAHWPSWVNAGFYTATQPKEKLVHSLEHGNIVIYYDQTKLSPADLEAIKGLAAKYNGQWDGVVAVPRSDAQSALILTAWENMLRLGSYDQAKVNQFVDAYRGRGPENPVRPL
jgi:hypothetical protein